MIVGRTDPLFFDEAMMMIHNAARGYRRAVNNLSVQALAAAFAAKTAIVDEKSARIAVTESGQTGLLITRRDCQVNWWAW